MNPNCPDFNELFKTENALSEEIGKTGALKIMENNRTPGTDGLTSVFYRYFWNIVGTFMVESFNYAFRNGTLSTDFSTSRCNFF